MKKAYKVFENDWTCRGYDFKDKKGNVIGTSHKTEGQIKLCSHGFHYCPELNNCFNYYEFNSKNRVAEIEIIGEVIAGGDGKEVTNEFRIIRELTWQEVLNLVNIGFENTGRANAGNQNAGNQNAGDWNAGNRNAGYFNTTTPSTILVFNKKCNVADWENATKPDFIYFYYLTKFIWDDDMND